MVRHAGVGKERDFEANVLVKGRRVSRVRLNDWLGHGTFSATGNKKHS